MAKKMDVKNFEDMLRETLSDASKVRSKYRYPGQKHLEHLRSVKDFGPLVTRMALDPQEFSAFANLEWQKYVEEHWTKHGHRYEPPEIDVDTKDVIRSMALANERNPKAPWLSEKITRVRKCSRILMSAKCIFSMPILTENA